MNVSWSLIGATTCGPKGSWFGPLLTEKSWLIVTPDTVTEKQVPGRGTGTARDLPPGCVRVHHFASVTDENELREWVSRGEPEKVAWEHEAGRSAVPF